MSSINKILVIGAGIAGPAVCYWLRRFSFSPILIERSAKLRKGGHPVDVRGVAIDLVKRMGIYEKICDMRIQMELGQYVDTEGNILHEEKGERFAFRQSKDVEINRGDFVKSPELDVNRSIDFLLACIPFSHLSSILLFQ